MNDGRPTFDWRLVESDDYRAYVKNLRDIGCPEATVRDIVTADVMQAFAAERAKAAAARYRDFKFYEFDDQADGEFARRRREVDDAMADVMRQLLGPEVVSPSTENEWRAVVMEQQLAPLPADKREQAREILLRFGAVDVELPEQIGGNRLTASQTEELQIRLAAFDERRDELLRVLTPDEYEQLDMIISQTGSNLRHAMTKFHPSEAEFKAIFREWRAHDERIGRMWAAGEPDPGNQPVFDNIRELLGEDRYQEYRSTWWK